MSCTPAPSTSVVRITKARSREPREMTVEISKRVDLRLWSPAFCLSSRSPIHSSEAHRELRQKSDLFGFTIPTRMRYLVGRGSPLTFSANHPLRNLVHENQLNDSSPNKIKSTSNTFQTPYQTPQHRHLPAHTPLRVRRMRKKIHLQENCEVGGYGARRLFKEEIYGISNHSMTHRERRVENGFDGGSSVVN
ncbi:hypothetical protein H4Q26_009939 [Puccinia striiformis f. sp. tritici PST-130]|nr:hypothetical protein H4Q26_009939 [Puccinia striiformis f. sp. tritici PST-130]